MLRRQWLCALLLWLIPASSWALDPSTRITQYAHAAWRARDGFFNGVPGAVAQTPDGYVWIGTDAGLLRFDGVRFVPWSPGGQRLPSMQITYLLVARDGSLWIGTRGGLSRWKGGTLSTYPIGVGGVLSIIEDRRGRIWFGIVDPSAGAGSFCQVVESTQRCYGRADGVPTFGGAEAMAEE